MSRPTTKPPIIRADPKRRDHALMERKAPFLPLRADEVPPFLANNRPAITRLYPNVLGLNGGPSARRLLDVARSQAALPDAPKVLPLPSPLPPEVLHTPQMRYLSQDADWVALAAAYWAYGWCLGHHDAMPPTTTIENPHHHHHEATRGHGGTPSLTVNVPNRPAPSWMEWFAAYARNDCQAPTCFYPHVKACPNYTLVSPQY